MGVLAKRPLALTFAAAAILGGMWLFGYWRDDEPANYESTLPDMIDEFGEDARVVSVTTPGDSEVTWEVLGSDRQVQVKTYTDDIEEINRSPGQSDTDTKRVRDEQDSTRAPEDGELEGASVTLGDLDPAVLRRIGDQIDTPYLLMDATLVGERWALDPNASAFEDYTARYDGTKIRRIKTGP